ncbi:MAG TPA: oxidoreductase [bacterium]|nr:oxidoreductase [bacterium]
MAKPKFAIYWAGSCGGCEIAFLDIREKILDVDKAVDLVFCPCLMDTKYQDVEAMSDKEIDVCLFNGVIRNEENLHMANLLRKKSKVLVAYGSCASEGCIPGLANLTHRDEIIKYVYHDSPSVGNPRKVTPQPKTKVKAGELTIPAMFEYVRTLPQVVDVDYRMPGCPPVAEQIWAVIQAVLSGALPEKGSLVGINAKTVCDECERTKDEKRVKQFFRPHLVDPKTLDPEKCLLEQGIICNGPATQAGCGALCPAVNLGCRGCYGPAEGIQDMGGKLAGAIASIIDSDDPEEIEKIVNQVVDPVGTFYRFNLPSSLLGRRVR